MDNLPNPENPTLQKQNTVVAASPASAANLPLPGVTTQAPQNNNSSWVTLGILLGVMALVFSLLWFMVIPSLGNNIAISDQPVVDAVHIDELTVTRPSFLVIQQEGRYGKPDRVITKTELLPPDTYADFDLPIVYGEFLPEEVMSQLVPGSNMYATLYYDTNNNLDVDVGVTVEEVIDQPVRDLFGNLVQKLFLIQ